jgi:serine/threonine-protein kinase HipA
VTELLALLDGRVVGTVRHERGRLSFVYADPWRDAPGAYPLSLSMPLAAAAHPHAAIEPFLWGLLPDNELVLSRWAQRFQVSPRNAFALLGQVGEDCAGAVQFVRDERREQFLGESADHVDWLTETDVANRLRALQVDASAGRVPGDTGQFSLAGAQPKTALLFDGERWGVPSGRTPTTHILKPQVGAFDGHAENEHLCLALARALGLPTTRSEVRQFEGVTAIVVERYDRVRGADSAVVRVHQEDFCQALHVHPSRKYQNDGGPGPKQIVDLLRAHASGARRSEKRDVPSPHNEDMATFLDALILNWLIGGTDAHAKNYSILIGGGGLVRLAPLYDVASILAYPNVDPQKAKLAMKIGDKYRLRDVGFHEWRKLAESVRIDPGALIERVREMALELPDRLADEVTKLHDARLSHPVIDRLAGVLAARALRLAQ